MSRIIRIPEIFEVGTLSDISLYSSLRQFMPRLRVTPLLMVANLLVFVAMLFGGAGLWHSPNGIQLAWGANFGPATQDGEWWRLGSALFLHFGAMHLVLNMWALWDGGQWVERMYGPLRFTVIYFLAGLAGNLLSLVTHVGHAVSGGASGAIFGVYGALLSYLWLEREHIQRREFRWLFWGALGFSGATIVFGLLIPGIDNAAHIGGFLTGLLAGVFLIRAGDIGLRLRLLALIVLLSAVGVMLGKIPPPEYRWSDEKLIRREIADFLRDDAAISQEWGRLLQHGKSGNLSFDQLADRIETVVVGRYEKSFEELSDLPQDELLPSHPTLDRLQAYAAQRRDASRELVDGLRSRDERQIRDALERARKSGQGK